MTNMFTINMRRRCRDSSTRIHRQRAAHQPRRTLLSPLVVTLLLLLSAAAPARASEGDRSEQYQSCTTTCFNSGCLPPDLRPWDPAAGGGTDDSSSSSSSNTTTEQDDHHCNIACPANAPHFAPPLALRLARWDCGADCAYHCMRAIEAQRAAAKSGPVFKYTGKWPFVRLLGAQELASVVFSLANLAAHVIGLRRFAAALPGRARGGGGGKGAQPASSSSSAAAAAAALAAGGTTITTSSSG